MSVGLVIGKFYPPHAGHHHLIDTALEQCDRVIVEVLAASHESISGQTRADWLREMHPKAWTTWAVDDHDVRYNDETWQLHMDVIRDALTPFSPEDVDVVFSSEGYGDELAQRLNAHATHVCVDPERRVASCSGQAIRNDPISYWKYLSPPVRAALTKRFAVVGAESTGTTTLTRALAERFETTWVPEYGRTFTEGVGREHAWKAEDFGAIVANQWNQEEVMARRAGPVMFCDTEALTTVAWYEYLMGGYPEELARLAEDRAQEYEYYLLTSYADVPWEDDGTRFGDTYRSTMDARLASLLFKAVPGHAIRIDGPAQERLEKAARVVEDRLAQGWRFAEPLEYQPGGIHASKS